MYRLYCCRIQLGNQVEVDPEDISVTFDDVKGADEAKQELKDVVYYKILGFVYIFLDHVSNKNYCRLNS